MSQIELKDFSGIAPRFPARQLENTMAQTAQNCRVDRGVLEPLNTIGSGVSPGGPKVSLYYYRDMWLYSSRIRHYVKTPLPNDAYDRLYYSETPEPGDSAIKPKVRSLSVEYDLGIPFPLTPMLHVPANSTLGDVSDPLLLEDRAYVCTFEDAWGQEGPPSDPLYVIGIGVHSAENPVSIALILPSAPSGNFNFGDGARINIYRTLTGSSATEYQYAGSAVRTNGSLNYFYFDTLQGQYLGEVMTSAEWIGPPNDDTSLYPNGPLQNMVSVGNGVLVGFSGNMVAFSEPFKPHAWPVRYRYSIEYDIMGLVALPVGLLILTEAKPYIAFGNDPSAIAVIPLDSAQACVSAESIVDMGDYAIYASQDGLCIADGKTVKVASRPLIDEAKWNSRYSPDLIKGWLWEGMYVASYGDYNLGTGFLFDPKGNKNALFDLTNFRVSGGWYQHDKDTLHLIWEDQGAWKQGGFNQGTSTMGMTWHSKDFYDVRREGMTWLRAMGEVADLRYRIFVDGRVLASGTMVNTEPVRLPSGNMYDQWSIELVTALDKIEMVNLASNTDELT